MIGEQTDWFILRTSGRWTLQLARTLAEDGFEAWTPVRTQLIRVPRMNVRREVKLPLLPSFVFVRAPHLVDLLELANMAEKPRRGTDRHSRPAHREFSVFHHMDRIPMIADRSLDPMRHSEREAVPRSARPLFNKGTNVRVTNGAFQGLAAKVERCRDGIAVVIFTDWHRPVKISTSILCEDDTLISEKSERAPRHRNAGKYLGQRNAQVGIALFDECGSMAEEAGREAA